MENNPGILGTTWITASDIMGSMYNVKKIKPKLDP